MFSPDGWLDFAGTNQVYGWHVGEPTGLPQPLALLINGSEVSVTAERFHRPDLDRTFPHASANAGFRFNVSLSPGDRVTVRDVMVGRSLSGGVRLVRASNSGPLRFCLCAIMKDEAPYILEWVAYHRAQGFELFVADNGGSDETSMILKKLAEMDLIKYYDAVGKSYFQIQYYTEMLGLFSDENCVIGFIDADEFLVPMNGRKNASEVLAEAFAVDRTTAFAINWSVFGSNSNQFGGPDLVTQRFVARADRNYLANSHVKTFVRGGRVKEFAGNPHAVVVKKGDYLNNLFEPVKWLDGRHGISSSIIWNSAKINHYVVKSKQEFLEKKAKKGSAISSQNGITKSTEDYFIRYDRNDVKEPLRRDLASALSVELEVVRARMSAW